MIDLADDRNGGHVQQKNTELIRFQVFSWKVAVEHRLETVGPNVMSVALIGSGPNSVTKLFTVMGVKSDNLMEDLKSHLKASLPKRRPKIVDHSVVALSEGGKEIMRIASEVCELMGDPTLGPHHVLLAILKHDHVLSALFGRHGVLFSKFRSGVKEYMSVERDRQTGCPSEEEKKREKVADGNKPGATAQPKQGINEKEILTRYCRNLTLLASQGKLDPVIGREKEILRLITTLSRRKKNNAILVGDPGVGKTAVVEGLAQRIVSGNVPTHSKTCQIFQLNMTSVVSKTTYRGQFEERMRAIMELFSTNRDYVLFVDEMHTLIGAGGSVGGLDAANIMKPALAGGEIRCIGATTEDEYRRYFKKDGALDRRFQRVFIDEPSKDEATRILMGIRSVIESHHECSIPDDVVRLAVDLSFRHVPDRRLPDKAIDCLDEACANAVGKSDSPGVVVSREDVIAAIAVQTDMPEEIVGVSDINRARTLSSFLKDCVVGQDAAINSITTVLLGAYVGIKDPKRPIGCLVLGGPSGSGTTFVAEKMAEGLFDSDASFVRINMSEFSENFGNTRLIGSPPGYVGYGDKNQLTDRVSRKPYCLVLLDGIENANKDVIRLFMQAMSKGVITDASGHDVSFRNAVIVMTLTFNASTKSSHLGFNDGTLCESDSRRDALIEECRKRLGEDFVNRIDEFVVFGELSANDIRKVAQMRVADLASRLREIGTELVYTNTLIDAVVSRSSVGGKQSTVKDVDRFVRKDVEPVVSRAMADSDQATQYLSLDVVCGEIACTACVKRIELMVESPT